MFLIVNILLKLIIHQKKKEMKNDKNTSFVIKGNQNNANF